MYVKCNAPKNVTKCKKKTGAETRKSKRKSRKNRKGVKNEDSRIKGNRNEMCAANVAKALEKVEGVEKAIADRTHDRVLIRLTGEEVDENAIKSALSELEGKNYEGIVE